MFRRVLIVASAEGFIVKGLETKLKNIGVESVYSSPRLKDLEYESIDSLVSLAPSGTPEAAAW